MTKKHLTLRIRCWGNEGDASEGSRSSVRIQHCRKGLLAIRADRNQPTWLSLNIEGNSRAVQLELRVVHPLLACLLSNKKKLCKTPFLLNKEGERISKDLRILTKQR